MAAKESKRGEKGKGADKPSERAAAKRAAERTDKPAEKQTEKPAEKRTAKPARKSAPSPASPAKKAAPKATAKKPGTKSAATPKKPARPSRPPEIPAEDFDVADDEFADDEADAGRAPAAAPAEVPDEEEAEASPAAPPPQAAPARPAAPSVPAAAAAPRAATGDEGDEDDDSSERAPASAEAASDAPPPVVVPPMPPRRADGKVTVAYSPDADDAFMMYAIEAAKSELAHAYATLRADIQTLNDEAKKGTYDVTALSFAAYPHVHDRYRLLPCGCSFGDGEGPLLVAKTPVRSSEVDGMVVAVPGANTTATLALRLWLPRARWKMVQAPFDQIGALVKSGKVRAGLLIHEGQLTWQEEGLVKVVDLGRWWGEKTEGLPLPLGANVVRRDIPAEEQASIAVDLKRSIAYALGHRDEALQYATKFGRGMPQARIDKYVQMYVNELTLDLGERGRQAARVLLQEANRHGFLPAVHLDFLPGAAGRPA
jgi:1,4-dihydroxy-6-naphthoate synthase